MFKKIENKIKELALKIHNISSFDSKNVYEDAKKLYELVVIYKYLSKNNKDSDWVLHEKRLNETLNNLNLNSQKSPEIFYNESEVTPLIDSIKDLVTEIPETNDDK